MVSEQEREPIRDGDVTAELRLRPERPPVTRLSRKVLMGLATIAAITVSGALIWALYQGRAKPTGGGELYNTGNKTTPDGLSTLAGLYQGALECAGAWAAAARRPRPPHAQRGDFGSGGDAC